MLRVIGFTGTIASGKTARCKHLLRTAQNYQLQPQTARAAATSSTALLTLEEAVKAATTHAALPSLPVGVKYINADLVGHAIYLPGKPCYYDLIAAFGERIVAPAEAAAAGGSAPPSPVASPPPAAGTEPLINRKVLGGLVFADKQKLHQLNHICGPYITRAMEDERAAFLAASRAAGQQGLLLIIEAALLLQMAETLAGCTDVWYTCCREPVAIARVMARDGLSAAQATQRVASQRHVVEQLRALQDGPGPLHGHVVALDTSDVTLEEGLLRVESTFDQFWQAQVAPFVSKFV